MRVKALCRVAAIGQLMTEEHEEIELGFAELAMASEWTDSLSN
jgi:hypothetical protein